MHLISCRNLLIYLDHNAQNSLLPKLHYGLRPKGFLFLGASESIGSFTDLFEQLDKKHKIFGKKSGPAPALRLGLTSAHTSGKESIPAATTPQKPLKSRPEINAEQEADRVTLSRRAPPGVLVNAEFQVLQFRGDTSPYLKPPTGRATLDVLKMASSDLMLPLRKLLDKAKKERKAVRSENVRLHPTSRKTGRVRSINIEVVPLKNLQEPCYLIFFEEAGREIRSVIEASFHESPKSRIGRGKAGHGVTAAREIAQLKSELAETREYLQSIQEQSEATNEELQASNEEITSANEELQSINEELETSQEELESTNEELITVNEEMTSRNVELNLLNSDLLNFQSSVQVPVLLLSRELIIRRFTTEAEKPFNLLAGDVGRSLTQIRHNLDIPDLDEFVAGVVSSVRERDREVQDKHGHWYSLRVRPYLSVDNKVDGAVLALLDIDNVKRTGQAIARMEQYAETIIRTSHNPLVLLDTDLCIHSANDAFYHMFKLTQRDVKDLPIVDIDHDPWRLPIVRQKLRDVLARNSFFDDLEIVDDSESPKRRILLFNARALEEIGDRSKLIVMGVQDITEVSAYQVELRTSELRYRRLFETAHDGVLLIDPETRKIIDANPFMTQMLDYTHEELCGKELFEIGILKDEQASVEAFETLRSEGQIRYEDLPLKTRTGRTQAVEFVSNLYREDGHQLIQCNVRDITARKQAQNYRDLLMAELDHRVKNTLATIQSIARQTMLHSTSLDQFRNTFDARIMALSQTHDLLTLGEWRSAPLRDILMAELSPYNEIEGERVTMTGVKIDLNSRHALALGLTIHELATNAAKYGALSVPNGKVNVTWDYAILGNKVELRLQWIESGGPVVVKPIARGFGTKLIEHSLANELGAEVQLDFPPEGVRFTLKLPIELRKP